MRKQPNATMADDKVVRYAVVDIETTGENMVRNGLVAFGVVIGNSKTGKIEDTFQVFVRPLGDDYVWEQRCLDEFWHRNDEMKATKAALLSRAWSEEGKTTAEAMATFTAWVNDNRTPEFLESLVFMSDTAGYDIGWLNYLLGMCGLKSMNYIVGGQYRPIFDSTSFHRGVGGKLPNDGYWGAESAAYATLKAPAEVTGGNPHKATHEPVEDAKSICWEILQVHRLIEQRRNNAN
jgi:DNA polymerase III epsilon subunit-like protein